MSRLNWEKRAKQSRNAKAIADDRGFGLKIPLATEKQIKYIDILATKVGENSADLINQYKGTSQTLSRHKAKLLIQYLLAKS
jgi:hypothetical protein